MASDVRKIMTATDTADVATLAMIEAMRGISDSQARLANSMEKIADKQSDMGDRLIRIESNQVDRRVTDLEEAIKLFKAEHHEKKGAKDVLIALWKHAPTALGYIAAIIVAVSLYLQTTGRL